MACAIAFEHMHQRGEKPPGYELCPGHASADDWHCKEGELTATKGVTTVKRECMRFADKLFSSHDEPLEGSRALRLAVLPPEPPEEQRRLMCLEPRNKMDPFLVREGMAWHRPCTDRRSVWKPTWVAQITRGH